MERKVCYYMATWFFDCKIYIQVYKSQLCSPLFATRFLVIHGPLHMHGSWLNTVMQLYDNSCNFDGQLPCKSSCTTIELQVAD
jgi:hypothetical protein